MKPRSFKATTGQIQPLTERRDRKYPCRAIKAAVNKRLKEIKTHKKSNKIIRNYE